MRKARFILLISLAALAVSATASASASAHEFLVEGTPVSSAVEGTSTSGTSTIKWSYLGNKLEIKSTLDTGTFTLGPSGTSSFAITLNENALYEIGSKEKLTPLSKCEVPPITLTGDDELSESSGQLLDSFKSEAGTKIIGTVTIAGSSCIIKQVIHLEGTMGALLPARKTEKTSHNIEFNPAIEESQSLTLGEQPAEFTSTESLELSGTNTGKKWSIG
jgi:hypothetical protein